MDWLQWDTQGQWAGYSGANQFVPSSGSSCGFGGASWLCMAVVLQRLVSLFQVSCVRGDVSTAESSLGRNQLGCNWTTAALPVGIPEALGQSRHPLLRKRGSSWRSPLLIPDESLDLRPPSVDPRLLIPV